jgi:hypothetical protein
MSIRKRVWKTAKGIEEAAWVVDYADASGTRRLKTFDKKKKADAFAANAHVKIREGVHVADSASVTVAEAGTLWIASAEQNGLERAYRCQLPTAPAVVVPLLGAVWRFAMGPDALRGPFAHLFHIVDSHSSLAPEQG